MKLSMEFKGVVYRRLTAFIDSCCFIIISSFIWFFNLIRTRLFRYRKENNSLKHDLKPCDDDEKDSPRFTFKFQHQFTHHHEEASKSSFLQKGSGGFMEDIEAKTWRNSEASIAEVLRVRDGCSLKEIDQNTSIESLKISQRLGLNASRRMADEKYEFSGTRFSLPIESQQPCFNCSGRIEDERLEFSGFSSARDFCSAEEIENLELEKPKFLSDEFSISDSDTESLSMNDGYSVKELTADSDSDGFFSQEDSPRYEQKFDPFAGTKIQEVVEPDELQMELTDSSDEKSTSNTISFISSPEVDSMLGGELDELEGDDGLGDESDDEDDDADDELEAFLEELKLIKELRMETRRVSAMNLPTIMEESEAPKVARDLRPWKVAETNNGDTMDEVHKFYGIYRERMKKLDTLNYQKMNTLGLKHCLQTMGEQKSTSLITAIKSLLLSHNLWGSSLKTGVDDQQEKWMKELQSDLETVYVGQTCLSWEWLRWQYEKLLEFNDDDEDSGDEGRSQNRYNEVGGEFQQFQAVLQRFMEDEEIRGPRLPNYVKNRFLLQNLLLVPLLREDSLKEVEDENKGKYIITSEILEDIMEESIGLFWVFVRADKDETPGFLKAFTGPRVQLEDPADSKLMAEIQSNLHKKEKKLRDILRTGNCLVNKLKKPKQVRLDGHALFSQIDLKLVSRVLRMSRVTTQQLIWCHSKLSTIWFVDAKVCREPSFLLFPC